MGRGCGEGLWEQEEGEGEVLATLILLYRGGEEVQSWRKRSIDSG